MQARWVREMESQDSGSTLLETVRIAGLSLEAPQSMRDPVAKICGAWTIKGMTYGPRAVYSRCVA